MAASNGSGIEDTVRQALADAYGIVADLERLPGENINFLVTAADGRKYVAKLAGDQQPPAFVALEKAALDHANRAGLELQLPLIQESKYKKLETLICLSENECNRLRLLQFIEGETWSELSDISRNLYFDLGRKLACFDRAMQDFDHALAHRTHRWDLTRVDQHAAVIGQVEDAGRRALLGWAMDEWTNHASPVLQRLPRQFIHGDPNPENLLVRAGRVTGLVDFGDCCWNPPVCELAICLAYQMMDREDPRAAAEPVIAGYDGVLPLGDRERRILPALVCGRLANTLCIATERRRRDPGHPNWFVSERAAWSLLLRFRTADGPLL